VKLALSPLWFLCVYAGLTTLTPLLCRLRPWAAAAAVVAVADLARLGLDGPAWLGWINVPGGWLVPYLLGIAWAKGALHSRRAAAVLLAAGVGGTTALVAWAIHRPAWLVVFALTLAGLWAVFHRFERGYRRYRGSRRAPSVAALPVRRPAHDRSRDPQDIRRASRGAA
jgi:hypothetical protein